MHPLLCSHVPLQLASLGFQVTAPLYTGSAAGYAIHAHAAAKARARAYRGLGECFARVGQCAGAQAWFDTARLHIVLVSLLPPA